MGTSTLDSGGGGANAFVQTEDAADKDGSGGLVGVVGGDVEGSWGGSGGRRAGLPCSQLAISPPVILQPFPGSDQASYRITGF